MTSFKTGATPQSSRWISREFSELVHRIKAEKTDGPHFDVLIVGSGYGGAVAATTFAGCKDKENKEIRVGLVERGVEYLPGAFPSRMADLPTHVRGSFPGRRVGGEGLFDLRFGTDVSVVLANGLGGGSLINAGVMEVPKCSVFESGWPASLNGRAALQDHYSRAKGLLGAESAPGRDIAKREVLRSLGGASFRDAAITVAMIDRDTSAGVQLTACRRCGDCATGCNYGAKESLDTNLLVRAYKRGAEIYCGGTALRVRKYESGEQGGWEVQIVHTDEKMRLREGEPVWVRTRKLVLAAGSLGSTELLLRSQRESGSLRFSPQLGERFSTNGDMLSFGFSHDPMVNAFADEDRHPDHCSVGPTITGVVDIKLSGGPAVIEEMAVPGPIRRLAEELVTTSNCLYEITSPDPSEHVDGHPANDPFAINPSRIDRTAVYAVMGDDGAKGSLQLDVGDASKKGDGCVQVVWPLAKHLPLFEEQNKTLALMAMAKDAKLGGRIIPNPMWRILPEGKDLLLRGQKGPLLTVHPLGGCAMGDTVDQGVVNHLGEVFDAAGDAKGTVHKGLFVLDGAIVPKALSTNPALTIAALALRATETLREKWGWAPADWKKFNPPEPRPVIANSVDRRAFPPEWPPQGYKPNGKPKGPGIEDVVREVAARQGKLPSEAEFMERMSGPLTLLDDNGRTWSCRVELTMGFKPMPLRDLFMTDAKGALSKARLEVGQPHKHDTFTPRSTLRVFLEKDWQGLRRLDAAPSEKKLNSIALCVFDLARGGTLTVMERQRSSACERRRRAGIAWLLNRGIRDILRGQLDARNAFERIREFIKQKARNDVARTARLPIPGMIETISGLPGRLNRWLTDLMTLLSHAGEVRLFRYELSVGIYTKQTNRDPARVCGSLPAVNWSARFEGKPIRGTKRITYGRPSNPWRQLMEMRLDEFPLAQPGGVSPVLALDPNYMIQRNTALMRIYSQPEHVSALADAFSLGAYILRMLLSIHNFNLRKPDIPRPRHVQRLPGKLTGLPEPEIHWVEVDRLKGQPVFIRLARYSLQPEQIADRPPVLMIHGYSASGTTFAHPALRPSLAQTMAAVGREAWVLDLRSSPGLPTATHPWTFERIALADIPAAVDFVYGRCGQQAIDVVAHCMGAAMFSMAVLSASTPIEHVITARDEGLKDVFGPQRRVLPRRIRRVVLSQVGPELVLSPQNAFRSFVYSYLTGLFGPMFYQFRPEPNETLAMELMDRLLSSLPYPDSELKRENHFFPWRRDDHIGARHRMDAWYGHTFELSNVRKEVLDHLDDLFGPMNLDTVAQVAHFARQMVITNRGGRNRFVSPEALREHWTFPTLSIHGEHNGLADPATLGRMEQLMRRNGRVFERWIVPGHGHQDCLIGKDAQITCEHIRRYLERCSPEDGGQ